MNSCEQYRKWTLTEPTHFWTVLKLKGMWFWTFYWVNWVKSRSPISNIEKRKTQPHGYQLFSESPIGWQYHSENLRLLRRRYLTTWTMSYLLLPDGLEKALNRERVYYSSGLREVNVIVLHHYVHLYRKNQWEASKDFPLEIVPHSVENDFIFQKINSGKVPKPSWRPSQFWYAKQWFEEKKIGICAIRH